LPRLWFVSTHWPVHNVVPVGHAHVPSVQDWPTAQARPHPPQFSGSVRASTQPPVHESSLGPQICVKQLVWQLSCAHASNAEVDGLNVALALGLQAAPCSQNEALPSPLW
jgi:hypothetical protein